jgi:hypothetical protein
VLRTPADSRFKELGSLVEGYLLDQMDRYAEVGRGMASRNVLNRCDTITYDEPGAANAYVLLHFLDRYHRFQLTFDLLARHKLMPLRHRDLHMLDVGTGPGPSMFALSDFYRQRFGYVGDVRVFHKGNFPPSRSFLICLDFSSLDPFTNVLPRITHNPPFLVTRVVRLVLQVLLRSPTPA